MSKSIAYYVKIKFQSQLDFDCTKPFKAIRSALNVKIVVEIELAPKLTVFDYLLLSELRIHGLQIKSLSPLLFMTNKNVFI